MKRVISFALLLLLIGCATPYQKSSAMGGYSETQLSENVFQVHFRGNGYTRLERAEDFTLLRSAEIALEHGYSYFIVVDSAENIDHSIYTTPVTTQTTANAYVSGNTVYGNARTQTSGGQIFNIRRPSTKNTIVCFKEKPENQALVYDASFIISSLRAKYKLDISE